MKPVYQTLHDATQGTPNYGNCFQACLASILELRLDQVPHFMALPEETRWESFRHWLREKGLGYVYVTAPETLLPRDAHCLDDVDLIATVRVLGICGEVYHSVITRNGKIIHDPLGDDKCEYSDPLDFLILFPMDPAQWLRGWSVTETIAREPHREALRAQVIPDLPNAHMRTRTKGEPILTGYQPENPTGKPEGVNPPNLGSAVHTRKEINVSFDFDDMLQAQIGIIEELKRREDE